MANKEAWKIVDCQRVSPEELNMIISAHRNAKRMYGGDNPIFEYKGMKFKVDGTPSEYVLLTTSESLPVLDESFTDLMDIVSNDRSSGTPTTKKIVRKSVKKAQMIVDTGLTEFVQGFFYEIDEGEVFKFGKEEFITLYNNKHEKRSIQKNRVKIYDVYTEPPVLAEANA